MELGLLFSSINLIHFIVQSSLINASVHCENVSECNRRNSWEIYHGSSIKLPILLCRAGSQMKLI